MFKKTLLSAKSTIVAAAAALTLSIGASATVPTYFQDFEGMTPAPVGGNSDLSDDGYKVGANVFDGNTTSVPFPGNLKFGFFSFPAPNTDGGGAFSSVATGDATPHGGSQYLNIFSTYECCDPPPAPVGQGHFDNNADGNGFSDVVNGLVFRDHHTIGIEDIGNVVTFSFLYKRPDLVPDGGGGDSGPAIGADGCVAPQCTANAFIKVLAPVSFAELVVLKYDTTGATQGGTEPEWQSGSMVLPINDSGLVGGLIQFGFETVIQGTGSGSALPFNNSGVYYDDVGISVQEFGLVDKSVPVPAFAAAALGLGLVGITLITSRRRRI